MIAIAHFVVFFSKNVSKYIIKKRNHQIAGNQSVNVQVNCGDRKIIGIPKSSCVPLQMLTFVKSGHKNRQKFNQYKNKEPVIFLPPRRWRGA